MTKIQSAEGRYSLFSWTAMAGVAVLHLVHGLAASLLAGTVSAMPVHGHDMGGESTLLESSIRMLLFIANAASMYFAVRQLAAAVRNKRRYRHTAICSGLSVIVLLIGIYTFVSI